MRAGPRDEQGAAAAFVAIVVVLVLVPLASLALDIGYQRVAARDMQALADVVAMDMARQLDGRKTGALKGAAWNSALANSLGRNDQQVVGPALAVVPCPATLTSNLSAGKICAEPGVYAEGVFTRSGPEPATHVLVKTQTEISYFFPVFADSGATAKEAIAESPSGACFAIGSYAARVRAGKSPLLGPLLGSIDSDLNLDVGDYGSLARTDVSLLDLLSTETSAGTIDEVINGDKSVGLGDFYLATAAALRRDTANAAQAQLLQQIALKVPNTPVKIGDLLALDTGRPAGLDAGLNVLDLVSAAAIAANGENAISVPELKVDLGPLARVQAKAHITEPPQIGCGRENQAEASTSQVGVSLDAAGVDLRLGILDTKVTLGGQLSVASATGTLTSVECRPNKAIKVHVQDGLLTVDLTLEVRVAAIFGLLPAIDGPIRITGTMPAGGDAEKVILVDSDYDLPAQVGSGSIGLPPLHVDTSAVRGPGGVPLGPVLSGLVLEPLLDRLVDPLVRALDVSIVSPLLSTLGVQISGADVFAIREPECGIPALRG